MNLSAIFSKTGKGVQEASGKTSQLSRADRTVLSAIDGKTTLAEVKKKFEKLAGPKFESLIQQLDKDGFIREVSSGVAATATPAARGAPPKAPPPSSGDDEGLDFTQAMKLPPKAPAAAAPKAPPVDLAAAARAESERQAKEQQAFDYKGRQEAELKAKAEAEAKARLAAEAKVRAESDARAKAEMEARARAAADAKALAEADAKVKAAREAAIRMATEVKAKAEAEGKAKADAAEGRERDALEKARRESEEKAKLEAELTGKLEQERKAREEAERRASEATERARKELEEKAKRDADELRERLEAEMKAKLEAERKAREEEDRKRREEDDRRRAEDERKRREEDERRRKEEQEQRAKEDAERKAREAEDRKRREDDDRKRAEEEKHRKEASERRAREDADRRAKEDADRRAREESEARAAQASSSASVSSIQPVAAPPPPPPKAADGLADSLLADLESFGKREEEELREKEEAERKAKEAAARKAKEETESRAREEAGRRAKEEAEKKRREDEQRRAAEEAEQRAREDEERQQHEEAERKRKAKEALAAKEAAGTTAQSAAAAKGPGKDIDDIEVTDEDLDMDDIKKDQKVLAATARKTAQELPPPIAATVRRPRKWGKPAAMVFFALLIGGVGILHVMPLSTAEYATAASEAFGVPVKIGSARLSVITGIEVKLENVTVGEAVKIRLVRGVPEVGSLFGEKKSFSKIELEGLSLSQAQLGDAVLGNISGNNFRVARIAVKQAKLDGPLSLPPLDVDAVIASDGSVQSVTLRSGDKLSVQLSPKGKDIGFEITAGSLALPFVPALNLSDFEMKGTANRGGVTASEFNGRAFDGLIFGTAKMRWGANWVVEGEVRTRGVKIAVLAPSLVSEGKVEGRGAYTMSGADPATLFQSARLQGEFKIEKGVLGSFDLTRALQTGGAQSGGRTEFSELTGQALYDKGAVRISNVAIVAGAMNAGATLEIDANGGLSGRIAADVKTPNQTLRATLNVSGKIQDPVIRK